MKDNNLENESKQLGTYHVTRNNLYKGMRVQDSEGKKGVVRNCEDLHNVHITFEGKGIEIDWYETLFECGDSGLYCFIENCEDNCEDEYPLYYCI